MPYEFRYNRQTRCLTARVFGHADGQMLQQMQPELNANISRHHCTKVLSDLREANVELSFWQAYEIPQRYAAAGGKPWFRRAIIVNERTPQFGFLETVCQNRGQSVRVFTDPDAARAWLAEA